MESNKLTRLTTSWHVTDVLAKLIAHNIEIKLKRDKNGKNRAKNNECNHSSELKVKEAKNLPQSSS